MNTKGNQGPRKRVIGYEITTGNRREWPSRVAAAMSVGMSSSWFGILMNELRPTNGYLCCYPENESRAIEKLKHLQLRDDYRKKTHRKPTQNGKVLLRIDNHTSIYVAPENATEEYAEQYRKRLAENKSSLSDNSR